MGKFLAFLTCVSILSSATSGYGGTVQIRDVTFPKGIQNNQLVGVGIVTGLTDHGDKDPIYTVQTMASLFQAFGLSFPDQVSSKNVAVVLVTATIPPHAKQGGLYDVTITAMGDAKSLQGGVLAFTALHGMDKKVYATAQGALSAGGSPDNSDASGANAQTNHPITAIIVKGTTVQVEIPVMLVRDGIVGLILRQQDSKTATRIAEAINAKYPNSSRAESAEMVNVKVPHDYESYPVDFVAQIGAIEIPFDVPPRVIVNERTGKVIRIK